MRILTFVIYLFSISQKIFCPDFSVKIFIHKSNVLSDLYRTLMIFNPLIFLGNMHFGSQILILNSGRLQISWHISLVAKQFLIAVIIQHSI